jgi:hypothetical protein
MTKANRRTSSRGRTLSRRTILFSSVYPIAAIAAFGYFFLPSGPAKFREPFFGGLGTYSRNVSTDSAMAQRYFGRKQVIRSESCVWHDLKRFRPEADHLLSRQPGA